MLRSDASTDSPIVRIADGLSISAIESLESYFREGGVSIIQAAFAHTYFVHPDRVKERTPYYPNRARFSRTHYPGLNKGSSAQWHEDGREVRLDDNQFAQNAWEGYTGQPIARGSGSGLRHIWGNPWNPDAFTAGWNFCYMPFWAGLLTERTSSLTTSTAVRAILSGRLGTCISGRIPSVNRRNSWRIPGLDLASLLNGQAILVLRTQSLIRVSRGRDPGSSNVNSAASYTTVSSST